MNAHVKPTTIDHRPTLTFINSWKNRGPINAPNECNRLKQRFTVSAFRHRPNRTKSNYLHKSAVANHPCETDPNHFHLPTPFQAFYDHFNICQTRPNQLLTWSALRSGYHPSNSWSLLASARRNSWSSNQINAILTENKAFLQSKVAKNDFYQSINYFILLLSLLWDKFNKLSFYKFN